MPEYRITLEIEDPAKAVMLNALFVDTARSCALVKEVKEDGRMITIFTTDISSEVFSAFVLGLSCASGRINFLQEVTRKTS